MRLKYVIYCYFIPAKLIREVAYSLERFNTYYRKLSAHKKKEFLTRVVYFERRTRFRKNNGELPEPPVIHLISSAFVQITFGLKTDWLKYFKLILTDPDAYSYQPEGVRFKGDVNPKERTIRLAEPYIVQGFLNADDAINVAIHEFGHALIVENSKRPKFNPVFKLKPWLQFKKAAAIEIRKIRSGHSSLFRKYAGSNFMEFFAVALEIFFERPGDFKQKSPELYALLCRSLNQDPVYEENPVIIPVIF